MQALTSCQVATFLGTPFPRSPYFSGPDQNQVCPLTPNLGLARYLKCLPVSYFTLHENLVGVIHELKGHILHNTHSCLLINKQILVAECCPHQNYKTLIFALSLSVLFLSNAACIKEYSLTRQMNRQQLVCLILEDNKLSLHRARHCLDTTKVLMEYTGCFLMTE